MDDFNSDSLISNIEDIETETEQNQDISTFYAPSDLKKIVDLFRDQEPIRMGISGSM